MATTKAFTDLSQSKVLAEILPLESADMNWQELPSTGCFVRAFPYKHDNGATEGILPCWSLAALINIIPQELFDGEYIINITEGLNHKWIISYEHYSEVSSYIDVSSDNLIDCCVEMIIKLNKLNLL